MNICIHKVKLVIEILLAGRNSEPYINSSVLIELP